MTDIVKKQLKKVQDSDQHDGLSFSRVTGKWLPVTNTNKSITSMDLAARTGMMNTGIPMNLDSEPTSYSRIVFPRIKTAYRNISPSPHCT